MANCQHSKRPNGTCGWHVLWVVWLGGGGMDVFVSPATQVVFTGGMGVNDGTVHATPGHLNAPKSYHDINLEVRGPAAADLVRVGVCSCVC